MEYKTIIMHDESDNGYIPGPDDNPILKDELIKNQLQANRASKLGAGLGSDSEDVIVQNGNVSYTSETPLLVEKTNISYSEDDIISAVHKYIKDNDNVYVLSSFFKRIAEVFEDNHEVKQEILQNSILEFINKYDATDQMVVVNFIAFLDRVIRNYNFNNVRRTSLNLNGLPVL